MQTIFLRTDGHSEAVLNTVRRLCTSAADDVIEELLHKELGNGTCKVSYADKKGKYQGQEGLTLPKVERKKDG
jgi:hypothetical protein